VEYKEINIRSSLGSLFLVFSFIRNKEPLSATWALNQQRCQHLGFAVGKMSMFRVTRIVFELGVAIPTIDWAHGLPLAISASESAAIAE